MKLPRDIGGEEIALLLKKFGYKITRQTGSHITIPKHKPLKIGTLNSIISDIAEHLQLDKKEIIEKLFK
ncbi:MAG: type II toxin-antitoxin system HicA family toxin [candidate division WOR-3 bacterium]